MAASTVLSVILLLMVGMQDQMSRAWSNANRRTDATREARTASILMADDFSFPIYRNNENSSKNRMSDSTTNFGLPFFYSSNGQGIGITISNQQMGSSCLFFVAPQRARANQTTDLGLVGYYVARDTMTNVNGLATESYNLHRYYKPSSQAWTNITNWFSGKSASRLFADVSNANDDILARNVANFRILYYNDATQPITNGANYTNASSGTLYMGNKMQVSLTIYPEDAAQRFASLNDWTNTNNIRKFARSYEFRIDCPRD
jgi:hypothetical protein